MMKIYKYNGKCGIIILALLVLQFYFLMVLMEIIRVDAWEEMYLPMLLTVVLSTLLIKNDKSILPLGANVMVFIYTILSLLGLLLLLPIFPEIESVRSAYSMSFLHYSELIPSISIACIGIIVFMLSTSVFSRRVGAYTDRNPVFGRGIADLQPQTASYSNLLTYYALVLLSLCLVYFLIFFVTNPIYFAIGYTDRTGATANNSLLSHATVVMALSAAMFFTVADPKKLKFGIVIFAMISIIQFMMGNRGEVYYPILACVAIYTKRGGTFTKRTMTIGVVGSLALISAIRVIRTVGAFSGDWQTVIVTMSPLQAIAEAIGEMGFQIGTIAYMLRYLGNGGLLQFGATYVYSFQTFLCKYVPFMPAPDTSSPAAIKTIMPTNYFAFTNIGESYYNFGLLGVYVFSIILAWYLVNSSKFVKGIYSELFFNMFLVEMILWVRNSSGTMPVYLAWTIVLLIGAKCFCGTIRRKGMVGE